jgi:PAS domain S-box-containing protein
MKWPWRRRGQPQETPPERRLKLLERVAQELTTGLDLAGIMRRALALSVQAVNADLGSVLLLDDQGRLTLAALLVDGKFRQLDVDLARAALGQGLASWVVQQRQTALVPDVRTDPRWVSADPESHEAVARAVVCVPMLIPRRVVGVLTCMHSQADHFDEESVKTLELIADQAAVALENAWLFAAEEQRRHLADTLGEIARTLTATLDLDEVLTLILEHLGRVIPYDSATIFLLHGNRLATRAWRGFENPDAIRSLSFQSDGDQILARVVSSREPIVSDNVQQEKDWRNVPGIPIVRGWIGAALSARGEVVGALTVDSHEAGAYGDEDARVVAAFADHAAIAVANARLWQQIQRRLDEAAFLYRTGQTLTASLDLNEVLRSLMISVRDHFHVEAASVALLEEDTNDLVFRIAVGAAAAKVLGVRLKMGQGVAGWVAKSGQPTLVPAARQDPRFYSGVDRATGFQTGALMAVPIRLGEEPIGVIEAMNPQLGDLDEEDLRLLLNVGALAASAIQNARHFTRAREAEQRYTGLFENSADPIVITDEAGLIVDVNRRMCEMLGWQKEDMLGWDIASLHRDPEATQQQLAKALGGMSVHYDVETLAHDGSRVPFEVRATRVVHETRPYVQWVCHDISERLELERAREDLTHMIVHDLRNPLTSIMSSLELIRTTFVEGLTNMPLEQFFAVAERSSKKLYLLIDSLLDLARLEDGQTVLTPRQIDVGRMVREVVEQMQPTAAARELHLHSHVLEEPPALWGDPDLLQRVLLNLLDNAIKFTPPHGEIDVSVSQPDPESLMFAISDTGAGIPPEFHEQIFDRFSRVPNQETRGTGLGLAFCRLAIDAHGGHIWAESQPEQGTTFKFTLPAGKGEH